MSGDEKQGVLSFGNDNGITEPIEGVEKPEDIIEKKELKSNRKPEEKRPYMVGNVGTEAGLRYYDANDVEKMRGMGNQVKRVIDPLRKIKSIDYLSNLEVACEFCEDMEEGMIKSNGIHKASYRVSYEDDKSSESEDKADYTLVCTFHKPAKEKEEVKHSWDWTNYEKD